MGSGINIKDYWDKEIRWYLLANIIIYVLITNRQVFSLDKDKLEYGVLVISVLGSVLIASAVGILAFLGISIFNVNQRTTFLYCGMGRLPGETIFSTIASKKVDSRFTPAQASQKYSSIIEAISQNEAEACHYQNAEWYKIYNTYRNVNMIASSNREYVLCRDIFVLTILYIVLFIMLSLLLRVIVFNYQYFNYLLVILVVTNIAARVKAHTLAINTIAYDLQAPTEE